jgi:glycerate kinase
MALKILIIPDKFKGTLSARQAAAALRKGWLDQRPGDQVETMPMSDGGDGFGEVLGTLLHAKVQTTPTVDAAHRPCRAKWWWEPDSKTAVIESARVIGLAMLPPGRFHPFELDTFGLGALLRAAAKQGAKRCIIGIGGSATNDGGFGFARSLGWQFLDASRKPFAAWTDLERLERIKPPARRLPFEQISVAVDVGNSLLGLRGATRVYGPQKGLTVIYFKLAERALRRLSTVAKGQFKHDYSRVPGAGAAGGLGFGLRVFAGADLEPGFELFSACAGLERRLRSADLVITGEGTIDPSTLMGKGVGQIAKRCRQLRVPCLGFAGSVADTVRESRFFTRTHALTDLTHVAQAKKRPEYWTARLAKQAAREWRGL